MKILIPVDSSPQALAPVAHVARSQAAREVLLVNVQPHLNRHIGRFASRAACAALRAERSAAAMAAAIEVLASAGIPFHAIAEVGSPAERIAWLAERERVDEVMIGAGRHPAWLRWLNPSIAEGVMARTDIPVTVFSRGRPGRAERYALPAGVAGLAALLLAAD